MSNKKSIKKDQEEADKLWKAYKNNNTTANRNALVEYYLYSLYKPVKSAYPMCRNNNELGDIFQSAVIGLIDAVECYDDTKNTKFETFSRWRIYGSIIDYLRKSGLISLPYKVRKQINEDKKKSEEEDAEFNFRHPYSIASLDSLAENVESSESYHNLLEDKSESVEDIIMQNYEFNALYSALEKIPEKEYTTLVNYYIKEKTLDEIAEKLNMTRAGVWQVRKRALSHIRDLMER